MLSIIRPRAARACLRASLLRPYPITVSAPGAGPALAPISARISQFRGLKTSSEPETSDYSKLSSDELNKGLAYETDLARASQPFNVEYLRESMARRPHRATYDHLSSTHSHLLNIALYDVLPRRAQSGAIPASQEGGDGVNAPRNRFTLPVSQPATNAAADPTHVLPAGHHLVYYPLQRPISLLEPDGTDPAQSPGVPFVRRMWAGGSLHFQSPEKLALNGQRTVCVEGLDTQNMVMRGGPGREKIFVDVIRRYGGLGSVNKDTTNASLDEVLQIEDSVWQAPALEERRTLVFMRAKDDVPGGASTEAKPKPQEERIIKAPRAPEYSFSFTPTSTLLFQFSALSYNAHSIHLDVNYCRNVEGYRDLLVHGPLTLVLMLSALRGKVGEVVSANKVSAPSRLALPHRYIRKFDYRNIAPLYANEELRVCVARNPQDPNRDGRTRGFSKWDVWVENSRGSVCARGTAITCPDSYGPVRAGDDGRPASEDDAWDDEWYYEA